MKWVKCLHCGKKELIDIDSKGKTSSGWVYYGKIDLNVLRTEKYLYEIQFEGDSQKWIKKENPDYNPKAKKKEIEYWECPICSQKREVG